MLGIIDDIRGAAAAGAGTDVVLCLSVTFVCTLNYTKLLFTRNALRALSLSCAALLYPSIAEVCNCNPYLHSSLPKTYLPCIVQQSKFLLSSRQSTISSPRPPHDPKDERRAMLQTV
uniref:Uncharacterized protein n=1 Tax=Onchocerca volvulus TaxID=6282 RepID=A0A8R1Y7I8_ONCVO